MKLAILLLTVTGSLQAQSWDKLVDRYFDEAVLQIQPQRGDLERIPQFR